MQKYRKRAFWFSLALILGLGLILRVLPLWDNNFFFTVDQANDALHVREIITRHQIITRGTETGIRGVYAGPLWYYFISIGYFFSGGHPVGGVVMMVLLNLVAIGVLAWQVKKKVSPGAGLVLASVLQFYWYFYDASRWSFNPFPLVFLSWLLVLLLIRFLEGRKNSFFLALITVGLAFNAELAGAFVFFLFYGGFGLWAAVSKRLSWGYFLLCAALLPGLFVLPVFYEFYKVFSTVHLAGVTLGATGGTFSGTSFAFFARELVNVIARGVVPQSVSVSVLLLGLIVFLLRKQKIRPFVFRWGILTVLLTVTTYVFFGLNKGWQDWHTYWLPPLVFVWVVLTIFSLPRRVGVLLGGVVLASQLAVFLPRYGEYFRASDNPSTLQNEIRVVDWIYGSAEHDGFNLYTHTPVGFDHVYQYLFWWYGRERYKYVPCEYADFPKSLVLHVVGKEYYSEPKLGCNRLVYLIVEPGTTGGSFEAWRDKYFADTRLIEEVYVERVRIEKREYVK